jgi:hypothetical protein
VKRFILFTLVLFTLAIVAPVAAQQASVSNTTSVDINGNRVQEGPQVTRTKSDGTTETTETMQSINGRMVPLERVEERVLRDDASGRVVERLIRRYDQQGNPTRPIKETIDEQKRADGSSSVETTTYRGDINGGMQLTEKSVTQTQKSDSTETSNTVIQRPNVNGGLDTVEKRDEVKVTQPNGYQTETTTYRNNGSGGFYVAVRQTDEHTQQGSQSTDNKAEYEAGATGTLQLHSQSVTNTVTRADGSQDITVDLYGRNVPGTVDANDAPLQLFERQHIEKEPGPNDTLKETVSVQRPTVSDPGRLGPLQQLSETVCKGDCKKP